MEESRGSTGATAVTELRLTINSALLASNWDALQDHLDHRESEENLEWMEPMEDQESQDLTDSTFHSTLNQHSHVSSAQPDHQELVDHREKSEDQDSQENQDIRDFLEDQESQDVSEMPDHRESQESRESLESRDHQEMILLEELESRDHQDHQDQEDQRDHQDLMGSHLKTADHQDKLERWDHQDLRDQEENQDHQDHLDHQEIPESQEATAHRLVECKRLLLPRFLSSIPTTSRKSQLVVVTQKADTESNSPRLLSNPWRWSAKTNHRSLLSTSTNLYFSFSCFQLSIYKF